MGGSMQENDMNQAELQAALDAQKAEMVSLIKSTVEAALVTKAEVTEEVITEEAKAEAKPTFTGDVNDPQALADYETALRGFELRKAIESGDMSADDIADMRKSMTEGGPSVSDLNDAGIKAEASDSKDVRDLQVKLFKARKGTNVPTRNVSATDEVDELAKSAEAEGLEIAKLMNAQLGNSPDAGGMRVIG
jgi:hypothetical protein